MINKILVAVDRSPKNQSVFDSAVSLAKSTGATLMLLHILSEDEADYPVLPQYVSYPYPILDGRDYEVYKEKLAEYKQWGLDFLQDLTQKATETGVDSEYTQMSGNPGRVICQLANTWSADLVIVGSRGLKGLKEMFLGSVSNYVTHHAPCSVLIVRTTIEESIPLDSIVSEEKAASNNPRS